MDDNIHRHLCGPLRLSGDHRSAPTRFAGYAEQRLYRRKVPRTGADQKDATQLCVALPAARLDRALPADAEADDLFGS